MHAPGCRAGLLGRLLALTLCLAPASCARRRIREFYSPAVFSSPLGEIDYATAGSEDGTPVLFIHGFLDSYHTWDLLIPQLSGDLYSIVPSLRGWGESSTTRAARVLSITSWSEELLGLLDHLRVKEVTLVSYSMGQQVALQLARAAPERVRGMMLVGSPKHDVAWRMEGVAGWTSSTGKLDDEAQWEAVLAQRLAAGCSKGEAHLRERFCHYMMSETAKAPLRVIKQTFAAFQGSKLHLPDKLPWPVRLVLGPTHAHSPEELRRLGHRDGQQADVSQRVIEGLPEHAYAHWTHPAVLAEEVHEFASSGLEPS